MVSINGQPPLATNNVAGVMRTVSDAEQEAGTENTRIVTPGRQHLHPCAAKAWAYITTSGGTPSLDHDYNIASLNDDGVGTITISIETDFSAANYAPVFGFADGNSVAIMKYASIAVGSIQLRFSNAGDTVNYDPTSFGVALFGDQ